MGITERIQSYLGVETSGALAHALLGLAILLIGLFIAKFFANIFKSLLARSSFLRNNNLVKPIVSLIKAVLTIFVLMVVLQHFGLTSVLEPLENLVNQFLSAVPRIIGAGVVGYAGWVIAKIVSELTGLALEKVDSQLIAKTGNDEIKVSKIGSSFVFVIILLPIVVAALGVLDIPAISDPASSMINELLAAVPNIMGAAVVLVVVYFAAKFVVFILTGLLESMNINALPEKLGVQNLLKGNLAPLKIVSSAIMFFSMLTAVIAAVEILEIEIVSTIFYKVLEFGGGLLVGSIILLIGNFLGNVAYKKLTSTGNNVLAGIARVAILGLVLAMGLKSMGLADNIINMAFGFTIGSAAVAFALAFGLGGRDAAKKVADDFVTKI